MEGPKIISKMRFFEDFDKSLICLNVLFLPKHESTSVLQSFCRNHMSGKNLVLGPKKSESWSKYLQTNQDSGFF